MAKCSAPTLPFCLALRLSNNQNKTKQNSYSYFKVTSYTQVRQSSVLQQPEQTDNWSELYIPVGDTPKGVTEKPILGQKI